VCTREDAGIWSGDSDFDEQVLLPGFTTGEVIDSFDTLWSEKAQTQGQTIPTGARRAPVAEGVHLSTSVSFLCFHSPYRRIDEKTAHVVA